MHNVPRMHNADASQWADYVLRHVNGDRQPQVAERTGISQGTISRWLSGPQIVPSAPNVVAFARAYGLPPVEALVAAGVLSPDEAVA